MKTLCMYATVRFMPFAETQEFANIGVVLCAPDTGKLCFRLARKRFGRINQFFDDLDGKLYGNTLELLEAELKRIQQYAFNVPGKNTAALFNELTRHREGVVYFGNVSTAIVDNIDNKLTELYEHYVERNFLNEKYHEDVLEHNIRKLFKHESIKGFKRAQLKTKLGEFKLPFVRNNHNALQVIKPIAFDRKTPLAAYEHATQWIDRFARLQDEQIVLPDNMMLAVEKPKGIKFEEAYIEALNIAAQRELQLADANNQQQILAFAKQSN